MDYYLRSIRINEELGNKAGIASSLNNIGIIYKIQGNYDQVHPVERDSLFNRAMDYYLKSLRIKEELGNKAGIASSLNNIAIIYYSQAELQQNPDSTESYYVTCLEFLLKSLQIAKEIGNKVGIAIG